MPTDPPSAVACDSNPVGSRQPWRRGSFFLQLSKREERGLRQEARQWPLLLLPQGGAGIYRH